MDELDLLSPLFSPDKALYSNDVVLPVPNVRPLDNLSKCRWLLPPDDTNYRPQPKVKPSAQQTAPPAPSLPCPPVPVTPLHAPLAPLPSVPAIAALPHAPVPVPTAATPHPIALREHRSVLTELLEYYDTGPLGTLKKAVKDRIPVKVWMRTAVGVKGTLTGTLLLFDKHMNLILKNVTEQNLGATTRSFDQLLLRGEHVITIALLPTLTAPAAVVPNVIGTKRKELT